MAAYSSYNYDIIGIISCTTTFGGAFYVFNYGYYK